LINRARLTLTTPSALDINRTHEFDDDDSWRQNGATVGQSLASGMVSYPGQYNANPLAKDRPYTPFLGNDGGFLKNPNYAQNAKLTNVSKDDGFHTRGLNWRVL
ncbi:hypothetical protein ACHWGL_30680, partial [Klebsiella pneumoniae]|uniref:hypothetical protein n=1 Tax=Klebsiella pneumoniae TaxID=573 RepID=UPI00376EFBD7